MAGSLIDSYQSSSIVSSTSVTITITNAIAVGDLLVMGTNRSTIGNTVGVASISGLGSNTKNLNHCGSTRTNTHDVNLHYIPITSAVSAGATLTVTHNSTSNRKTVIAAVFRGLNSTPDAESAASTGLGNTDQNENGASSTVTASTTGSTVSQPQFVIGLLSVTGGFTITGNDTEIQEVQSAAGSADRGIMMQYRNTTTINTKTSTGTMSSSGAYAACVVTFPVTPPSGGTLPSEVVIGGAKKTVAGGSVIIGGAKKTIVGSSVIIGGAKKSLT